MNPGLTSGVVPNMTTHVRTTYPSPRPSARGSSAGLALPTSGWSGRQPHLFDAYLTAPAATAAGLLAVANVALTRYDGQPRSDGDDPGPLVTAGDDRLRFESFSGCAGVYARLDVLPSALDGEITADGTASIAVSPSLRLALTAVRGHRPLHLTVGPDAAAGTIPVPAGVSTPRAESVAPAERERTVPLPQPWLRGFAQIPLISPRFGLRAELGWAQLISLLGRSAYLERLSDRPAFSPVWLVPADGTLRPASGPVPGGICLPGASRLDILRPFLRHATGLRVYGPPVTASSAPVPSIWELVTAEQRLSLTLSPDRGHGFSGECALPAGFPADLLASAGRLGYDVAEARYYHRHLPCPLTALDQRSLRQADSRNRVLLGGADPGSERQPPNAPAA